MSDWWISATSNFAADVVFLFLVYLIGRGLLDRRQANAVFAYGVSKSVMSTGAGNQISWNIQMVNGSSEPIMVHPTSDDRVFREDGEKIGVLLPNHIAHTIELTTAEDTMASVVVTFSNMRGIKYQCTPITTDRFSVLSGFWARQRARFSL